MPFKNIRTTGVSGSISNGNKILFLGLILLFYFIWMDIALFVNLQRFSPPPIETPTEKFLLNNLSNIKNYGINNKFKDNGLDPFSIFKPLSVKLIMVDHMTHYIHDILARFLVDTMHFTQIFPWISANLVSFIGLGFAVLGSRLTLSDSLFYRQIGALLFELRNLADSLDGVVYRARKRVEQSTMIDSKNTPGIMYSSNYGTFGKQFFEF